MSKSKQLGRNKIALRKTLKHGSFLLLFDIRLVDIFNLEVQLLKRMFAIKETDLQTEEH